MTPDQIASTFRAARSAARPLDSYPGGEVPATLASAYAIQQLAIAGWPDQVVGWKVAAIQANWRTAYPDERVAGPVFSKRLARVSSGGVEMPIIRGGYAAAEAEFALLLGADFPVDTAFATAEQLRPFVAAVHAAIELAGSPLPNLSALGPGAVISDFGNNIGLVIGPELENFFARQPQDWPVDTTINDVPVGEGSADRIPGGPLAALLFLANSLVSRGDTLRPGHWVSTGASTGVHPVSVGDQVQVMFDGQPVISLRIGEGA
jgi:2-keto-4-pentenoate hydratase